MVGANGPQYTIIELCIYSIKLGLISLLTTSFYIFYSLSERRFDKVNAVLRLNNVVYITTMSKSDSVSSDSFMKYDQALKDTA